MKPVRAFSLILVVVLVAAIGAMLVVVVPQWLAADRTASSQAPAPKQAPAARKIKATLFYVAQDGEALTAVDREVPYGSDVLEQARRIVEAELGEAPPPLLSAFPPGTRLRALYVTPRGEAYVDLSREVAQGQPGGSLPELLTVYAIVNALTSNLPAVHAVQLLVDGREVDTLAGHVDLRRPLPRSRQWLENPARPAD